MLRIACPFCGVRDEVEFRYRGDAGQRRPADGDEAALLTYVYKRDNPRGWTEEWWQHVGGCRQTLRVRRGTLTHAIASVAMARAPEPDR